MDNSCVANSSYTYIIVMLSKLIFITIKCLILSTTPFDFIIGRNVIKKHLLINRFSDYFDLLSEKPNGITKEIMDISSDIPSTKVKKVTAAQIIKSIYCTDACFSTLKNGIFIASWPSQPERPVINFKRQLETIKYVPHTVAVV